MTEQYVETPLVYTCAINTDLLLSLLCVGMRDGVSEWRAFTALLCVPTTPFTLLLPHDQINPGMAQGVCDALASPSLILSGCLQMCTQHLNVSGCERYRRTHLLSLPSSKDLCFNNPHCRLVI